MSRPKSGVCPRFSPRGDPAPAAEPLEPRLLLSGFVAYNDTVEGPQTHPNTTLYADNGGDASGQMKDIVTGTGMPVLVSTYAVGAGWGSAGVKPAGGTDAGDIFNLYVDFTSVVARNSIELAGAAAYTYRFSDLGTGTIYDFTGTAVRGNAGYTNRWTLVTLIGAESYTPAHSTGVGIVTAGLGADQVALWTGANHLSDQGFVVRWSEIDPGLDGEFEIVSHQYTGSIPTEVDPSGVAGGTYTKGYALNAVRLIEGQPFGAPEVVNVPATEVGPFSARMGGEILVTGGEAPNVTLYYGDNDGGTDAGLWDHGADLGLSIGDFSTVVGGLDPGTPYYFRTFAQNSFDSAWAPTSEAFVTVTVFAPSVVTQVATNVGAFSAHLNGEVTDTGNDPPLVKVYYGASDGGTDPGGWEASAEMGVQSGTFAAMVTDLEPETTYYFTAYARNAVGSVWATPSRLLTTGTPPPLEISEFMADNATTLTTRTRATTGDAFVGDTDSPDWIEIHNPTDAAAVLGGFHLTDDLLSPKKWEFPAGTVIPPYGYLVVFASGDDITDPNLDQNGYLHTSFGLKDAGGEDVAVTDADGAVVFACEDYPAQIEDTSYGVDDLGEERFYPAPTPGWDNDNLVPQAPVFSVASTAFTGSVVVDLAPRYPTDRVRYTTNETVPTAFSPVWPGPMTVSNTTMIRAVAIGAGGRASRVVSETYVELGADMLDDNTNLPIVVVEMFGDGIPGSHQPFGDCFIAIIEPGADGRTTLTDPFDLTTRGGIHIRGSSSAGFYKKQYRVEFWDESNEDRQLDVLDMPAEADWILYGPGPYDRALINNPFVYDLSNQVGQYATRTRWVEMYLNSGGGQLSGSDYYGVYAIMEVIEQDDDRLDIDDLSTGAGGVPVSGGFAWKNDRGAPYVEPEDPNAAQRTYIDAYINALNSAAVGQHAAWADLDIFIDNHLLNMLPMNVDAFRLSAYYYKTDEDGKLMAGPVWDFDRALESTDGRDNNPYSWLYFFNVTSTNWWARMFRDPDFVQKYIDRWFELRETVFSLAGIYATIDAHAAELAEAAPRDYARWQAPRYGTFAGEIQHMKTWLTNRINWIDSQWLARPTTSIPGPVVTPGTTITLSAPQGTVYYTTDGSDPRASGGSVSSGAAAGGPISITEYTKITARVYRPGHRPSYGEPGYITTGDDWSAPTVTEYFVNPLVASGDVVITEMNYHPHDATPQELATQPPADPDFEDNDFEFVEFMNVGGHPVNIAGVHFTDAVTFAFDSHVLAPGDCIVVVEDLDGFTARYGINGSLEGTGITVAGVWAGALNNGGELATVAARDGGGLLNFAYDDTAAWPGRADGKGAALQLIDPWAVPATEPGRQAFLENPDNWQSSNRYGGSPGAEDDPDITVVVNEVLTHTDDPLADAIELHNTSTTDPVDISGWWLSDSWGWDGSIQNGDYKKFRIPDGTVLAPGEYRVFDEGHYVGGILRFDADEFGYGAKGFGLNGAHGDDVWLVKADAQGNLTHFVDHVDFGAAANGESFGRWPDGTGGLYPMAARTLPDPNAGPRIGPLLISEVHYHPTAGENLEFIEIYNPTPDPVDLWETWFVEGEWQDYPWKVEGFQFAAGTTLAAGRAIVVVPFDPDDAQLLGEFKSRYGLVGPAVAIVGPFDDPLDDDGETVRLRRPDAPPLEEPLFTPYLLVDEVDYEVEAPWPTDPNGGGTSLNRTTTEAWGNDPAGWHAAPPTPGIADVSSPPPRVVSVALNRDPRRTLRGPGQIDPSALGVRTVLVTFSNDVTFLPGHVIAEKVKFDAFGSEISAVSVTPASVAYGGTGAEMVITFADSWETMVDTWVRITLAETITDGADQALDGEPRSNSSGLGYIYEAKDDLPSGDGAAGGAAVFYVGSLRGDMRGYGPGNEEPDGEITPWDITGFTQKYLSHNLDADMAGYGPGQTEPDDDVNPWDISGFTSRYSAAMAAGTHLELLPTSGGEGLAVGTPEPLPLVGDSFGVGDAFGVADETVSSDGRVAWPRLRGHVLPRPALTMATQHRVAIPPALVTSADPLPSTSAPWSPASPSHGRVAWPRLRGHVLPRPAANMATQHRVAMPPALVVSADPLPSTSAPWSPAASDTAATDTALAAGNLFDLLSLPALDVHL